MKMAKASEADLEMAMELCGALDCLTQRWGATMPEKIERSDGACDYEYFDRDDSEQCRRVMAYLLDLAGSASLMRVVFGCAVMLDPRNQCVDPAADTIEHHPDITAALAAKTARPSSEWHDDIGAVLWWKFPIDEPPFCGTPLDSDWHAYHTHWTPLLVPDEPVLVTPSVGDEGRQI